MSLAAARDNWRFLLKFVLLFAVVVVLGPLALVALVAGSVHIAGSLGVGGEEIVLVAGLAFIAACFAWLFIVLAIGNRRTASTGPANAGAASSSTYGDGIDG